MGLIPALLIVAIGVAVLALIATLGSSRVMAAPGAAGAHPAAKAGPVAPAAPVGPANTAPATETAAPAPAEPAPAAEGANPAAEAPPAPAPPPPPAEPVLPPMDDILNPVKDVVAGIEAVEKVVERVKTSDVGLAQQRADIERVTADAERAAEAIRPRLDAAKAQLDKLGPAPKAGQPADSAEIAAERARIGGIVTALEGALKSTELVKVRARQLQAHVQELRQALFTQNLFERSGSPVLPGLWRQLSGDSVTISHQLETVFGTWQAILLNRWPTGLALGFGSLALYVLLWLATRRAIVHLAPRNPSRMPSYTARATAATLTAPLYVLPAVGTATAVYVGANNLDLTYSRVDGLTGDLFAAVLIYSVVSGLASAILTPRKPEWRLLDLADGTAASLRRSVRLVALIYGLDLVKKEMIRLLGLSLPFSVALSFLTALAFALVLLWMVTMPFVPARRIIADAPAPAATGPVSRWTPRWLKLPLLVVAIGIVAAALAGYVALSRFVAGQVVITGSAVVLVMLLHLAIRTTEKATVSPSTAIGDWLTNGLGLGETHRALIGHSLSAILHLLLAVVAVPGVFLAWGFSFGDSSRACARRCSGSRSATSGFRSPAC